MELRHLRYFEVLADEMHFGRAALRLHISQPALSKQIKELEEELGLSLFIRLKKSIELTDAGKVFREEAQKTLKQAEMAIFKTQLVRKGNYGELRIGYDATTLFSLLTPLLKELRDLFPDLKVTLKEGCNLTLSELLREDTLDIAFIYGPVVFSELASHPMYTEEMWIALPANHPLALMDSLSLAELRNENFILHPRFESPVKYDEIIQTCQNAGFMPKIIHENASLQARISMVASGMGISFTVSSFTRHSQPGVVFVPIEDSLPQMQLMIAWKRSKMRPILSKLLTLTKEIVQKQENDQQLPDK